MTKIKKLRKFAFTHKHLARSDSSPSRDSWRVCKTRDVEPEFLHVYVRLKPREHARNLRDMRRSQSQNSKGLYVALPDLNAKKHKLRGSLKPRYTQYTKRSDTTPKRYFSNSARTRTSPDCAAHRTISKHAQSQLRNSKSMSVLPSVRYGHRRRGDRYLSKPYKPGRTSAKPGTGKQLPTLTRSSSSHHFQDMHHYESKVWVFRK